MIEIETNADKELLQMADRMQELLSVGALEERTMQIAAEAGQILLQLSVQACIRAVYDHPNFPSLQEITPSDFAGTFGGNLEERTNALLDAHHLVSDGLTQRVEIDPNAEARGDVHSRREMVMDYAPAVHDGYTQFVYGRDTGIEHPGRFWLDGVLHEQGDVVVYFVIAAFEQAIQEALGAALL